MRNFIQLLFTTTKGTTKTVNVNEFDDSIPNSAISMAAARIVDGNVFEGVSLTTLRAANHVKIETKELI